MKKNFSVNIKGNLFQIDEDAYDLLQEFFLYLEKSFDDTVEKKAIIDDFHERVAQILLAYSAGNSVHIVDVNQINKLLADFGYFHDKKYEEEEQASSQQNNTKANTKKRLFRHPTKRIIGGVCSGIATYLNMDILVVRILFVVFSLLFALGVFAYMILWIVVPVADSPLDRLSMDGEPLTVDNIRQRINTEFAHLKNAVSDLKHDENLRNNIEDIGNTFKNFITTSVVFRVLIGGFFIGVSMFLMVGLFMMVLRPFPAVNVFGLNLSGFHQVGLVLYGSSTMGLIIMWSLFVMLMLPFFGIFIYGTSIASGVSLKTVALRWISQYVGTLSLLMFLFCAVLLYLQFLFVEKRETHYLYKGQYYSVLNLELGREDVYGDLMSNGPGMKLMHLDDEKFVLAGIPILSIEPSSNDSIYVSVQKRSYGRTLIRAARNCERVNMGVSQKRDTLFVDPFWISDPALMRA